jgi:hypothetical protein
MLPLAYLLSTFVTAGVVCYVALPSPPRLVRATVAAVARLVVGAIVFDLLLRQWGVFPPTIAKNVLLSIGVCFLLRTAAWWATLRLVSPASTAPSRIWGLAVAGVVTDFLSDLFLPALMKWSETAGSTIFI